MTNPVVIPDQSTPATERLEILTTDLLVQARPLVEDFRRLAGRLNIELGWHYLLDLPWAAQQLAPVIPGMRVLDAGAGTGFMQWWLAEQGADVISVDRLSRRDLSIHFRQRYPIQGWREGDLGPASRPGLRGFLPSPWPRRWHRYPQKLATSLRAWLGNPSIDPGKGTVFIYNQGLESIADVADASVDAIVSISSLEHNPPNVLRVCVGELMRVLKPGGRLIATLGAAKDHDWFHDPSQGWCYTETTLRDIFGLPPNCPSNYNHYDHLLEDLRNCSELRQNLADAYYKSGNNGMPWGRWDPQYQSVGLIKIKKV